MEDHGRNRGTRRRRKRSRSFDHGSLRKWAKDDVPDGDPRPVLKEDAERYALLGKEDLKRGFQGDPSIRLLNLFEFLSTRSDN